jgi:hypothetical protein
MRKLMVLVLSLAALAGCPDGTSNGDGSGGGGALHDKALDQCKEIGQIADEIGCGANSEPCEMIIQWPTDAGCLKEQVAWYDCVLGNGDICVGTEDCTDVGNSFDACIQTYCQAHHDPRCPVPPSPSP